MTPATKLGDVWDALDAATLRPTGAGLGMAYFAQPGHVALPNRHFADARVAGADLLKQLAVWDIRPTPSGKYQTPTPKLRDGYRGAGLLSMADWSDPGVSVIAGVNVVAFYLGGWTPHVWTKTQIAAQTVTLMMPIWVYNPGKPGSAQGTTDGNAAIAAAKTLGVPTSVRIALDMEAVVDTAYVSSFRSAIAGAGYFTVIYGSASTVFGNWSAAAGPGGGWWVADWTGTPHLYSHAGVWATQWTNDTPTVPWDQSAVGVLDHLWPHIPAMFTATANVKDQTSGQQVSKTAAFVLST